MRRLTVLGVGATLVLLGVVGCGSARQARPVAEVKRAFASAGVRLHALPGAVGVVEIAGKKPYPVAILESVHRGQLLAYVAVFRSARDAMGVFKPGTTIIITDRSIRHLRVRNVLVEWRGKESPRVAAAVRQLR